MATTTIKMPILKSEIVTVNGTTDSSGLISVEKVYQYNNIFVLTNVSAASTLPYSVTINGFNNDTNTVRIRIRNMSDNSAVANTSVNFKALLIGI